MSLTHSERGGFRFRGCNTVIGYWVLGVGDGCREVDTEMTFAQDAINEFRVSFGDGNEGGIQFGDG